MKLKCSKSVFFSQYSHFKTTGFLPITEYFGEFNSDQRLNAKEDRKWKDSFLAQYPQLDTDEFRNQLFADLNLIHVEYEIMDKRENSRRGNRA